MKKIQRLVGYLLCVLTLSACQRPFECGFDIYEVAHFHDDGTGKLEILVDLAKARKFFRIERYINRSKAGYTQMLVKKAVQDMSRRLRKVGGISKVFTAHDKHVLHLKLGFHFNSIGALNKAMRKIHAHVGRSRLIYFKMNQKSLVRLDPKSIVRLVERYQRRDDSYIASFDLKTFFKDVTYKTVYSFDKEVKKVTNKSAIISRSRRMVVLQHHLLREKERSGSISNQIFF